MAQYDDDPIVVAVDAAGALHHVDEVPNGLACGCFCPAPGCNAQLVAKNRGKVIAHHFAHRAGSSCEWALESTFALLAREIITELGIFRFPGFAVRDFIQVEGRTLPVISVAEVMLEGWGAPVLKLLCQAADDQREFLLIFAWHDARPLAQSLADQKLDTVVVNVRDLYNAWKYGEARHSDRTDFLRQLQQGSAIQKLATEDVLAKQWLTNAKREVARRAYRQQQEELQRQREAEFERARLAAEREFALIERQRIAREERATRAKEQRANNRLHAMEEFCEANGLQLLEVAGAGRLVTCPLKGRTVGVKQTSYGCCVCEGLIRDFGTHIACAAQNE